MANGRGRVPPGIQFMPTPIEALGLNGTICFISGLMREDCSIVPPPLLPTGAVAPMAAMGLFSLVMSGLGGSPLVLVEWATDYRRKGRGGGGH